MPSIFDQDPRDPSKLPMSPIDYSLWSDQQVLGRTYNANATNMDPRLWAEYQDRWGSHVHPNSWLGHVYRGVDSLFGTVGREAWNHILNAGNVVANHPMRQTWNGGSTPPPGIYLDENGIPRAGTQPTKPGNTLSTVANTGTKTGNTMVSGKPGAGSQTMGNGAGVGGFNSGAIANLFGGIDARLGAIQNRNADEEAKYKNEADTAFNDMQAVGNAPPPQIDPRNQMYSMLAANIAKVLNPNIDAPGQAQQLMNTKLEGMRDQNRQRYQVLAEKYRRASELFDKRGDTKRSIELARASDNMIKQAEMTMNESHFQQQLAETRADRLANREDRIYNRQQARWQNDTATLRAYSERLSELVKTTKDDKERQKYQTKLVRSLRMLDKVTTAQLSSMDNPQNIQPVNPDVLYSELFDTLDASQFPRSEKDLIRLFNRNKNFNKDRLVDTWGLTREEIMSYWRRVYGGPQSVGR
jgi:hypothetical protein